MTLPNTFARRKRAAEGRVDVYDYENVPATVRNQLCHIFRAAIGDFWGHEYSQADPRPVWSHMRQFMLEEKGGEQALSTNLQAMMGHDPSVDYLEWIKEETDLDFLLTGIELTLREIDGRVRLRKHLANRVATRSPDRAIAEANARFQEAQVGYQYTGGVLIRIDSQFIHAEVVVPALHLLVDAEFAAADSEYRAAHKAFRDGRGENALTECAKAFESVLKVLNAKHRWGAADNATAKPLLDAGYAAGFFDAAVQQGFSSLRALLESAVPTPRNKSGAHGAGVAPRVIPEALVAYQLHQTAAAIVYLVETDKARPV